MKFLKPFITLLVVCALMFSCKSEKKEASSEDGVAVEEMSETSEVSETAETNESAEASAEEPEAEESTDEKGQEEPKEITVNFPKDSKLAGEVNDAIKEFVKGNPEIKKYFNDAYGFAVFPKITKGGLGIGGAGGHGLVFDNKTVIGESKLAQATFGLQAGGQTYMEVIFFEDQPALNRFTAGKVKFSGQASAVALKEGTSVDIDYQDGVAIYTKTIGGLMAEASVGGQSFKFKPGIN